MRKIVIFLLFGFFAIGSILAFDLRVTEVFVDGTDEWIEISNIGPTDFVGSLILSGVKSSSLVLSNVSVPTFSSLLVGDTMSMLSTPNNLSVLGGRGLSLVDTAPINISLFDITNTLMDTFVVTQSLVQSIDNTMTSFQKLYNGGGFDIVPTVSSFASGVISPSLANPGKVYATDGSLWLPMVTTQTGSQSTTGSLGSGSNTSGSVVTGSQSSGGSVDCAMAWSGILVADEIYNGTIYSHYIELLFLQDRNGSLEFSGSALSSGFILPTQSYKANMRYLVASTSSGLLHTDHIIISPMFRLSSGDIRIKDTASALSYFAYIDNIGQSVYFSNSTSCIQNLTTPANPSPGFDRQFLSYLSTQTITTTIIQTITGACTTGSTTNLSGSGSSTGSITTGTTLLSGMFNFHDVRISLIHYDPPGSDTNTERLGLTIMTGDLIPLSGWSLGYDGKTYKFLTGMLSSGVEYIRTANFGFVNSRTICISLYYLGSVIDTVCYDPTILSSPVYPLTPLTGSNSTNTGADETFDYSGLRFDIITANYDPDGSDIDRETVTLMFLGGASGVLLDDFRLRVGTINKRIYGTILSGQTLTLMGNFQMPNTKGTCIALSYSEIIYDEYCYNSPTSTPPPPSTPQIDSMLYTNRLISLISANYDPDGSDTDRETITVVMTGGQASLDLTKLYLRIGTQRRYLNGTLSSDMTTIVTGNFQMPNSKSTCVDLMEGTHIFDSYCYDPNLSLYPLLSGALLYTGDIKTPKPPKPSKTPPSTDRKEYYSGLQLQWILPNPSGKDIKKSNEKIGLSWRHGSGQMLTSHIKLLVGKTSISLSGYYFTGDESILISPKSLTNQAACVRLVVDGYDIDKFCYPQSKEGSVYYHPRLQTGPHTIPSSLIASLDIQGLDLSDLHLKKIGKKICLTYERVQIRCMNAGSSTTSAKNKALLSLSNAYIKKMSTLISAKDMDYILMDHRKTAYRVLSDQIKAGHTSTISVYGRSLKVNDISSYVTAVYDTNQTDYLVDQFASIFFGHQAVDNYYKKLYE